MTTAALYVLLIGALFLLGMWLVGEINNLLHTIRDADLGRLTEPLNRLFLQAGEFLTILIRILSRRISGNCSTLHRPRPLCSPVL